MRTVASYGLSCGKTAKQSLYCLCRARTLFSLYNWEIYTIFFCLVFWECMCGNAFVEYSNTVIYTIRSYSKLTTYFQVVISLFICIQYRQQKKQKKKYCLSMAGLLDLVCVRVRSFALCHIEIFRLSSKNHTYTNTIDATTDD